MGQQPRDLSPTRSALDFFGAELRCLRERAGLSMGELAVLINFDSSLVGKVERAERVPSSTLARKCDDALGTDGRLQRLWGLVEAQRQLEAGGRGDTPEVPGSASSAYSDSRDRTGPGSTSVVSRDELPATDGQWFRPRDRERDDDMRRRNLLRAALAGGGLAMSGELIAAMEAAREGFDRTLTSGTVSPARMAVLQEAVDESMHAYTRTPPLPMLATAVLDFIEIDQLAADRQTAAIQAMLSEASAKLATLAADALMKLGRLREARGWYRTARVAADDTPNVELRARVRAQEGMLPYYYGDPAVTVRLAREAQAIAVSVPCPATALAAAAEARALAKLGRREEAERAMERAQQIFGLLATRGGDDAFSFPEQRLLLYMSGTLANLGETKRARVVQTEALALYGDAFPIDPALIRLDQALCLASDGEVDDACDLARTAIHGVPASHRTTILLTRGRDVAAAIGPAYSTRAAVSELHEVLALTPGVG